MSETHISFYLKTYRIHIFAEALRGIGCPHRICFMLSPNGQTLALLPYDKRDFRSHKVAQEVYQGGQPVEISSYRLCSMLADLHSWDRTHSYRVPGQIIKEKSFVLFDLTGANIIERERSDD